MLVELYDEEGVNLHASGEIENHIVAHCTVLERNERYYSYFRVTGMNSIKFVECAQRPYVVTEF